jgi:hypothetical protein
VSTVDDDSPETEVGAPRNTGEPALSIPTVEKQRRGKTWRHVGAALAIVVLLALGYFIGYSTSGSSSAKSQRNHAQAMLFRSQQEWAARSAPAGGPRMCNLRLAG